MESYNTRPYDYGFSIGSGNEETVLNAALQLSYELRQNFFIEAGVILRNYKVQSTPGSTNSTTALFGIRWNMFKRDYDL